MKALSVCIPELSEESNSNEIFVAVPKMVEENVSSKSGAPAKISLYEGSPFLSSPEYEVVNVENPKEFCDPMWNVC